MSIAALNWAFTVPVEGPSKAVLVALANHANDECECWPNQERISLHSGFATRTVRKAISDLVKIGVLIIGKSFYILRVGVDVEIAAQGAARKPRPHRHHVPLDRHHVPTEAAPRAKPEAPRAIPIENHQEPPKEPPVNHQRQTAMILPMVGGKAAEPKAQRIPPGWMPDQVGIAFCQNLGLDPRPVLAKFTDYWLGASGTRAKKADWPATWRNWCRTEAERGPARGNSQPRVSAAQAARDSHFQCPAWDSDIRTIDGNLVREYG